MDGEEYGRLVRAARAALAEEAKAKEPEVVIAPSGWTYRYGTKAHNRGTVLQERCGGVVNVSGPNDYHVPPQDREAVAALLKGVTP